MRRAAARSMSPSLPRFSSPSEYLVARAESNRRHKIFSECRLVNVKEKARRGGLSLVTWAPLHGLTALTPKTTGHYQRHAQQRKRARLWNLATARDPVEVDVRQATTLFERFDQVPIVNARFQ